MVSVDDLGQGSEAIRILGIKWLPPGNAKKDVAGSGVTQGQTQARQSRNSDADSGQEKTVPEGMEAEEGDFVNAEVGFSYRASSSGKSMRVKAKKPHLYLVFYLPGGVQLRELTCTIRLIHTI